MFVFLSDATPKTCGESWESESSEGCSGLGFYYCKALTSQWPADAGYSFPGYTEQASFKWLIISSFQLFLK